jgi:hypothetical protein
VEHLFIAVWYLLLFVVFAVFVVILVISLPVLGGLIGSCLLLQQLSLLVLPVFGLFCCCACLFPKPAPKQA